MIAPAQRRLYTWFDYVPHAVAVFAMLVGVLVLIGWRFDIDMLKSVLPGLAVMKVNNALGFVLAGTALWASQAGDGGRAARMAALACAAGALALGLLTLGEYLSGADFGIDQMMIREETHFPGDIPGRMSVNSAASLTALGIALLLLSWRKSGSVRSIHALAMVPVIIGGSALIGYGYDIEGFLREKLSYSPMSMHAATISVLLAFGVVNARPEFPFRRFVTCSNPAGGMARQLFPAAIIFPVATGWLIEEGYRAGYFSAAFALALFTAATITGVGTMILSNAGLLYHAAVRRERVEVSLRESEERLNTILKIVPVGLWVLDAEGKIVIGNNAARRIWAGVRWVDIEHFGDYQGWRVGDGKRVAPHEWAGARALEKGETIIEEEIEIACFDGTHKIILDSAVPLRRPDGSIRGAVTINQDITERKRIEEEFRRTSEEIHDLYDHAPCGYHSLDENGVFIRVNQTELAWLGYRREELVGKMRFRDMITPNSFKIFQERFPELQRVGYARDLEFEVRRKDGSLLPVLISATAIYDASGRYVASRSMLFDLTERKKWERELERQARKDGLTGMNNRRHFFELADQEVARSHRHSEPLSLLMLDLDKFKSVNDTYGHEVGDAALRKLSEVCQHTFREIDITGRLGGEEFAALLPETNGNQAMEVAERLRHAVENVPLRLESGHVLHFTVSIGLASFGADDTDIQSVLRRADAALYKAKSAGRNRVCRDAGG